MGTKRNPAKSSPKPIKAAKLSRSHVPADLSPVEWQRTLRRQFGREQSFDLENIGAEPFFSDFRVSNPQSKSHYRVAIRGLRPNDNFCSCPDYASNELGTCKHIVNSHWPGWRRSVAPSRRSRVATSRRFPNSICAMMTAGRSISAPGRIARQR